MREIAENNNKELAREAIMDFEEMLKLVPDVIEGDSDVCPLEHYFCDGIYARKIFLPKGMVLTGKIHKHDHPNFLVSGEVEVFTEGGGYEVFKGPMFMISQAGTKRVIKVIADTVWVTIHANRSNTQNFGKLEKDIIAKDYDQYNAFDKRKNNKVLGFFKNILKIR